MPKHTWWACAAARLNICTMTFLRLLLQVQHLLECPLKERLPLWRGVHCPPEAAASSRRLAKVRGPLRSASSMALVLRLAPLLFFLLFLLSSKSISAVSQMQLLSLQTKTLSPATACELSSRPACLRRLASLYLHSFASSSTVLAPRHSVHMPQGSKALDFPPYITRLLGTIIGRALCTIKRLCITHS